MANPRKLLALLLVAAAAFLFLPRQAAGAVDQEPPKLDVYIPRVVNVEWVDVVGQSEPGATVLVNGKQVTLDEKGEFATQVQAIQFPVTVTVVAIDAAGNQSVASERVKYTSAVPWLTAQPLVGIPVKAPQETLVKRPGAKNGIYPDSNGLVRWLFRPQLGWNYYWIRFEPPGAPPYYHLYSVLRPVEVELPAKTNLERLSLPARLAKDWKLRIDGKPVTTDAEGRFTLTRDLAMGSNEIKFQITLPNGLTLNLNPRVWRIELGPLQIKDGRWKFRVGGESATVFGHAGLEDLWVPVTEQAYWEIPLQPGFNDLSFSYIAPSGAAGILRYQFDYEPTK